MCNVVPGARARVSVEIKSNGGDKAKIITSFNKCNDRLNTDLREE